MSELLKINNVTRSFNGRKVLDGLSLSVEAGKIVGLLAPNGVGKTTLFRHIAGLLTQDSGEILVDGKKISKETNALVSYLPDYFVFDDFGTIRKAAVFMQEYFPDFDVKRMKELLAKINFDENRKFSTMSKGEKEQVQLVLFLSRRAKLYLLDEPLAAVDPAKREFIINTILSSFGEENSVIISTHLVLDIEKILDEVIMLKDGKVCVSGDADALRDEYGKNLNDIFKDTFRFVEGGN